MPTCGDEGGEGRRRVTQGWAAADLPAASQEGDRLLLDHSLDSKTVAKGTTVCVRCVFGAR